MTNNIITEQNVEFRKLLIEYENIKDIYNILEESDSVTMRIKKVYDELKPILEFNLEDECEEKEKIIDDYNNIQFDYKYVIHNKDIVKEMIIYSHWVNEIIKYNLKKKVSATLFCYKKSVITKQNLDRLIDNRLKEP